MTATATKERPILFSGPMVRAILAGRKTQTRRIIKNKFAVPLPHVEYARDGMPIFWSSPPTENVRQSDYYDSGMPCPYGVVGDRLWVRETWNVDDICEHENFGPYETIPNHRKESAWVRYRATDDDGEMEWRPSIHMPRWASRIILEISGIAVERLNDISENDAISEGCIKLHASGRITDVAGGQYGGRVWSSARKWYRDLWESINGTKSWDANPWVWVVGFKRVNAC